MHQLSLKEIKRLIKRERKLKGISQKEMATQLGITQAAYSHFESDDKPLPVNRLNEIAQILNIDTLDFSSNSSDQMQVMNSHLSNISESLSQIATTLTQIYQDRN